MERRFRKVGVKPVDGGMRVSIQYELADYEEPDRYSVEVVQAPHPDFTLALGALAYDVVEACELPGGTSRIEVRGVSISHKDDGQRFTITALRKLERHTSPLVLNTPALLEGEVDPETLERLEDLLGEAGAFLDGKRAQLDVFEEASA